MILRWWRRRREQRQAGERWERRWGALARYNAERARGIVHSAGYQAHMADEKAAYDAEQGTSSGKIRAMASWGAVPMAGSADD